MNRITVTMTVLTSITNISYETFALHNQTVTVTCYV